MAQQWRNSGVKRRLNICRESADAGGSGDHSGGGTATTVAPAVDTHHRCSSGHTNLLQVPHSQLSRAMLVRRLAACSVHCWAVQAFVVRPHVGSSASSRGSWAANQRQTCNMHTSPPSRHRASAAAAAVVIGFSSLATLAPGPAHTASLEVGQVIAQDARQLLPHRQDTLSDLHAIELASSEDDMTGALGELSAAKNADATLAAMVRINDILDSDDGTMDNPLAGEVCPDSFSFCCCSADVGCQAFACHAGCST